MAAYSYSTYLTSQAAEDNSDRKVVTINPDHPLNNMHRPPFWSGSTAARALLAHAENEMTSDRGEAYFNRLLKTYDNATITDRAVTASLNRRTAMSAAAFDAIDFELSDEQIIIAMRLVELQSKMGEPIMTNFGSEMKAEEAGEKTLTKIDSMVRKALSTVIQNIDDGKDATVWEPELVNQMTALLGEQRPLPADRNRDIQPTNREMAEDFVYLLKEMETLIPRRAMLEEFRYDSQEIIDEKGYEVYKTITELMDADEANFTKVIFESGMDAVREIATLVNDPEIVAEFLQDSNKYETLEDLADALNENVRPFVSNTEIFDDNIIVLKSLSIAVFDPRTEEQREEGITFEDAYQERAEAIVYSEMSKEELELAATTRKMTPLERAQLGTAIINSFPPTIKMPEFALQRAYFDVRAQSVEEAQVMQTLLEWAGETRQLPEKTAVKEFFSEIRATPMANNKVDRPFITMVVTQNAAAIEHAKNIVQKIDSSVGIIVIASNADVATDVLAMRNNEPIMEPIVPGFNRSMGAWQLNNNKQDYAFSFDDKVPLDAVVAASDNVFVFHELPVVMTENPAAITSRMQEIQSLLSIEERNFERLEKLMLDARDPALTATIKQLEAAGPQDINDKDAKAWLATAEGKLFLEKRKIQLKEDGVKTNAADRTAYGMRIARSKILQERRETATDAANASAPKKLVEEFRASGKAMREIRIEMSNLQRSAEKLTRQRAEAAYRSLSPIQIGQAHIIEMANDTGKLAKVYSSASVAYTGAAIVSDKGKLIDEQPRAIADRATVLLSGIPNSNGNVRRIYRPTRGVQAVVFDGSNMFYGAQGKKEIENRLADLPKTATVLIQNNEKNPIVKMMTEQTKDRRQLPAFAWRLIEKGKFENNGMTVTLKENRTIIDLGYQAVSPNSNATRPIRWQSSDIKGTAIMVNGAGTMTEKTYSAIHDYARSVSHVGPMNPDAVAAYYEALTKKGEMLDPPQFANNKSGRAIMQEALIDHATEVVIAADLNEKFRDFHSANMIRSAFETDKLNAVIDGKGNQVDVMHAYEMARPFAPSIAEKNLSEITVPLKADPASDFGQLTLMRLGVTTQDAIKLGRRYDTLGEIAEDAMTSSPNLEPELAEKMMIPRVWQNAIEDAAKSVNEAQKAGLDIITASDIDYPHALKANKHNSPIYFNGTVDWDAPRNAVIAEGNRSPNKTEMIAMQEYARDARLTGTTLVIHMHDDFSAGMVRAISAVAKEDRPEFVIVGDGNPNIYTKPSQDKAMRRALMAGATYVTATPVAPIEERRSRSADPEAPARYPRSVESSWTLTAAMATSATVVKASNQSQELMIVARVIQQDKPVAVLGPQNNGKSQSNVDNARFTTAEYAGGVRLLQPGSTKIPTNSRMQAIEAFAIPDDSRFVQPENHGFKRDDKVRDDTRRKPDQAIISNDRVMVNMKWSRGAPNIGLDSDRAVDFMVNVRHNIEPSLRLPTDMFREEAKTFEAPMIENEFYRTSSMAMNRLGNIEREIKEMFEIEGNRVDVESQRADELGKSGSVSIDRGQNAAMAFAQRQKSNER